MVTVLGSDTGRGRRARRPERNCRPGGHGHGHVQPRSCDANLGARLRLATSDHCPTRFLGSHVADRQAAHRRHLVSVGVLVLTGFDKVIEASLTRAMPDWLVSVTTRL